MFSIRTYLLTIIVCLAAQTSSGITDVPDLALSEASIAFSGPGVPTLLVVPDGNGNPFTAAHDQEGNVVDATITLHLRDSQGMPMPFYPGEDIWLESHDGGLVSCIWGTIADQATNHDGVTQWVHPAIAGGYSEGPALVFIAGSPLTSNAGLPLKFNSPDINGDLVVNLTDVAFFAGDYFFGNHYRSDLNGDGVLNLLDVSIFMQHFGAQCP